MKRITLFVMFLSIIFCFANYTQGSVTHTVSFDRSKLQQWIEDEWDRFSYENADPFGKVGEPEIPAVSVYLIIPANILLSKNEINRTIKIIEIAIGKSSISESGILKLNRNK